MALAFFFSSYVSHESMPLLSAIECNIGSANGSMSQCVYPMGKNARRIGNYMRSNRYSLHLMFSIAIVLVLTACSDARPTVPDQIAFIHQISLFEARNTHLNYMNIKGKDENGELPPEDLAEQIAKSDQEILKFLNSRPKAVQWIASVVDVRRENKQIFISASYRNQSYGLILFDEQAKKAAEKLKEDDEIAFTGVLCPEQSRTKFGALLAPEFLIAPSDLSSKYGQIKQSSSEQFRCILQK